MERIDNMKYKVFRKFKCSSSLAKVDFENSADLSGLSSRCEQLRGLYMLIWYSFFFIYKEIWEGVVLRKGKNSWKKELSSLSAGL